MGLNRIHQKVVTLEKLAHGVTRHFGARFSEWLMVFPALGMSYVLSVQDDMFTMSPSFSTVAEWGSEHQWAFFVGVCGFVRLIALAVNGTFSVFPYSPHLRMFASCMGIWFWGQFSAGFLSAFIYEGGALSAVIAYSTFTFAELRNVYLARSDMSARRK